MSTDILSVREQKRHGKGGAAAPFPMPFLRGFRLARKPRTRGAATSGSHRLRGCPPLYKCPVASCACSASLYGGRKGCSASLNIIGCVLDAAVLLPGFDASHALAYRFCTPNRSHRFDSMFPCATCHLLKHIETDFSETGMFAMFAVILSYVVIVMKPVISTGPHTHTDMRWLSANGTGSL